jgi:hypothetical protein
MEDFLVFHIAVKIFSGMDSGMRRNDGFDEANVYRKNEWH